MGEKIIVSGRNIEGLFPHVDVWGFGIALYLFIGGLAAGILLFATYFYIKGKQKEMPVIIKISTFIPPIIIAIGLLFLIGDLHHKLYFWQLMLHFEIASPMSWGAWVLLIILVLSIFWPLSFLEESKQYFEEKNKKLLLKWSTKLLILVNKISFVAKLVNLFKKYRLSMAYTIFFLSIILGIYTGILLSSFNARPLWNTPILGLVFLVSGISTGAALLMWLSDNKEERKMFSKIDLALIGIELLFIGLMFLGLTWGSEVQQQAAAMFFGGDFTAVFWGVFAIFGLILPAILEILELNGKHIPIAVPATLILLGGLIFRMIIVSAGQISTYTF